MVENTTGRSSLPNQETNVPSALVDDVNDSRSSGNQESNQATKKKVVWARIQKILLLTVILAVCLDHVLTYITLQYWPNNFVERNIIAAAFMVQYGLFVGCCLHALMPIILGLLLYRSTYPKELKTFCLLVLASPSVTAVINNTYMIILSLLE